MHFCAPSTSSLHRDKEAWLPILHHFLIYASVFLQQSSRKVAVGSSILVGKQKGEMLRDISPLTWQPQGLPLHIRLFDQHSLSHFAVFAFDRPAAAAAALTAFGSAVAAIAA